MRTGITSFTHRLIEAFRRASTADHREVLDEAFEGFFGHHVRARVGTARRCERALGDVDERVRLNAEIVHATAVAVIQQARVAHLVASAFGHIADSHTAAKRQNGQQQNQATHPIPPEAGDGKPANGRWMQLLRQLWFFVDC
ncbi:hypothetical protein D3C87_1272840 [compost metagenome]